MQPMRGAVVLALLALTAAACGARLNPEEVKAYNGASGVQPGAAASGSGSGSGSGSATGGGTTGSGGGGTTSTSGTGTSSGTGSTTSGSTTSGSTTGSSGTTGPAATVPPGGNGGATDVGVTADAITLGNVATLTGPVPGLFKGAVVGTEAFLAYQNSLGGVYGRQLKLKVGDDRLSADENRAQIIQLTPQVLAFVGSFSVYDDAGAPEMQKSGVPDVGYSLSPGRAGLANNFTPQPLPPGWRLGSLNYFKQTYGDAVIKKVGALVVNVDAPKRAWAGEKAAMESDGYHIVYLRPFQPTETDFTSDIVQMKGMGIQMIVMSADVQSFVRVAQAAQQQGFKPRLPNYGANAYDPNFITLGGSAVEGTEIDQQLALYAGEDAGAIPEVALFNQWARRIDPNYKPDIFGAFSWASARLFVQALLKAGPKATRAGLLAALRTIDDYDDNGMLAPAGPASKRPPVCYVVIDVRGGKFVRKTPATGYRCNDGGYFRLAG
jgi:ABC-type branched-subunit amino acid transport system substrate-binding protein